MYRQPLSRYLFFLSTFCALFFLCSCGRKDPVGTESTETKYLGLQDSEVELTVGEQFRLQVTVVPETAKINWHSSDESIVYVSPDGLLSCLKPGKATIDASSGEKRASCEITVLADDGSTTFKTLPSPEVSLFGATREQVDLWEQNRGSSPEDRLSGYDEARNAEAIAFNTKDDHTKLRIYYLGEMPKAGSVVTEIEVLASPIDYVLEIKDGKGRLNQAFRRLMTKSGYFLSNISPLGVSYVNPRAGLGVIVSPIKHPEIGILANFDYKPVPKKS